MTMPPDKVFTDQMGREITVPFPLQRIISIVPSQTELLFDLGLDKRIVGLTKFCIHPKEKIAGKTKVGGTKQLNIELITSLKPDLIIANKEENEQSQVEELAQHFPVWISDINDLDSALEMIKSIGNLTGTTEKANVLSSKIRTLFGDLPPVKTQTVAYLIWRKPYMLAGKGTFIDDMLTRCGLVNVLTETRYPEAGIDKLAALNPDLVFLSSEPYPFKQKHADELQQALPNAEICLVDGEMFSWYGSRMLQAVPYFKRLLYSLAV